MKKYLEMIDNNINGLSDASVTELIEAHLEIQQLRGQIQQQYEGAQGSVVSLQLADFAGEDREKIKKHEARQKLDDLGQKLNVCDISMQEIHKELLSAVVREATDRIAGIGLRLQELIEEKKRRTKELIVKYIELAVLEEAIIDPTGMENRTYGWVKSLPKVRLDYMLLSNEERNFFSLEAKRIREQSATESIQSKMHTLNWERTQLEKQLEADPASIVEKLLQQAVSVAVDPAAIEAAGS